MKEDKIYILHILEAIKKTERYVKNVSFEEFLKNEEKKDAVVRNLEIIGEAAAKVSDKTKKQHLDIQWRDIIDMRNRLIHEYFGVDFKIVWNVIKEELPILHKQLKQMMK